MGIAVEWDAPLNPSPDFVECVLGIVATIPAGRVMTYGDVASAVGPHPDLAGSTGAFGARLVGNVMARYGADVPWWRVIRSTGHPPKFLEAEAWPSYQEEGTPVTGDAGEYRVDLKRARWQPDAETPEQASLGLF